MKTLTTYLLAFLATINAFAQDAFNYRIELTPVNITGLPGLHSYVYAQHNGMWLVMGGRKDGIHARQPFNAFPGAQNNTDIYVIDVAAKQFWSASVNSLSTTIAEQLQSTNMTFFQEEDTLYVIGGYAYSNTAGDHITFDKFTTVQVSSVIQAVITSSSVNSHFRQISDSRFAVTGAQMGKIGDTFYLVGGHRFDGRYNPMGNPTYTQTYASEIKKFKVDNSGIVPVINNYTTINDAVHLRRRDYNLLPQIFPDGSEGYTISSGVFQLNADLPFLYPVDIKASGYTPITTFNQYLSNYHSAKAALYDSNANQMHMLFFGGMSQYYYENGTLKKDDNVPFVKTISRVTRIADGTLKEYQLPVEMPGLKGASAEFIPNHTISHYPSEILKLNKFGSDTTLIGHIYGGIYSPSLNPFTNNSTSATAADNTIYAVTLIHDEHINIEEVRDSNPYGFELYPNPPQDDKVYLSFSNTNFKKAYYYLSSTDGRLIQHGDIDIVRYINKNKYPIRFNDSITGQAMLLTVVFDDVYFITKKIPGK